MHIHIHIHIYMCVCIFIRGSLQDTPAGTDKRITSVIRSRSVWGALALEAGWTVGRPAAEVAPASAPWPEQLQTRQWQWVVKPSRAYSPVGHHQPQWQWVVKPSRAYSPLGHHQR